MPSSLPKRRRRPIAEWRSPSFVDITNVQSFAHPKGGARANTQRAPVRRQADKLRPRELAPAVSRTHAGAPAGTSVAESLLSAGDRVNALYADGSKYPATISKVYLRKRQCLVDWADGDSSHRTVRFEDVSPRRLPKRRRAVHAPGPVAAAPPASSAAHAACTQMVDVEAAGRLKAADAALLADDEGQETRWDSSRLAQLCAKVERLPVKHSTAFWSQVADCMRREHNMPHVQPSECQQAYTSRFPTPTKRRQKAKTQNPKQAEEQTKKSVACIAGTLRGAEPDDVEEAASLEGAHGVPGDPRPAACPPRPGTIKWKSYVRAVLAESDRNHVDDVFAHHTEGNGREISRTSAIRAAEAAVGASENGPSNAGEDPEEEHEFFTAVTEQQRRDMDGYLALLQRRGRGGSVFRGGKAVKPRY